MTRSLRRYQFGDWLVEPDLGSVRKDEDVRKLEPKAMDVLVLLLEHAGQVLSPAEILDSVWAGRIVEEGAVHQKISQIRGALGDDRNKPCYIESIPKRGYRTLSRVAVCADPDQSPISTAGESRLIHPGSSIGSRKSTLLIAGLSAAIVVAIGFGVGGFWLGDSVGVDERQPEAAVRRFTVELPDTKSSVETIRPVTFSADGRRLAFVLWTNGGSQLYSRSLDSFDVLPIKGTRHAGPMMAFSPDGRWIAFVDMKDSVLKKVPISGGIPVTLCDPNGRVWGISWGANDRIVYDGDAYAGLMQVSSSGGMPRPLTVPEKGEMHKHADILPDGGAVFFAIGERGATMRKSDQIAVMSLETGELKRLMPGASPRATSNGHLIYYRSNALWAVEFDADRLEVTSNTAPVAEDVLYLVQAHYSVSDDGTLAYVVATNLVGRALVWVDRTGTERPLPMPHRPYLWPRVSPAGDRIGLVIDSKDGADLWVHELERGTATRLTFDESREASPVWTHDGRHIIFSSNRIDDLFRVTADGAGVAEQLTHSPDYQFANAVTLDNQQILFGHAGPVARQSDIAILTVRGEPTTEPLLQTEFNEAGPSLSPNGQWLAYTSTLSGQAEIYLRPFPDVGAGVWQVSIGGGIQAVWGSDEELFYLGPTHVMSVAIETQPEVRVKRPETLFDHRVYMAPPGDQHFDFDRVSGRFLMIKNTSDEDISGRRIFIVENWLDEVFRKIAAS